MIDYVRLHKSIHIPKRLFNPMIWTPLETEQETAFFQRKENRVTLRYYPETENLTIAGKIVTLLHDTQVSNLDDIYGARLDLFYEDINQVLSRFLPGLSIDIRSFEVSRVDYCFNVETPYVNSYIELMTRAHRMINHGQKINFTDEKELSGSVYIKNTAEYRKNLRTNYTLNFYDKTDQLTKLQKDGAYVSEVDMALAKDILRLEVQASHLFIKNLCQHFSIEKTVEDLFQYRVAIFAITTAYSRVFHATETQDYYTYAEAKKLVPKNTRLAATLRSASTSHSITDKQYSYGRMMARKAGIFPYCFLPKGGDPSHLKNPIQLILDKTASLSI